MNTKVETLGECKVPNPANYEFYTKPNAVVLYDTIFESPEEIKTKLGENPPYFEQAGPMEKIFFEPREVVAGIVTCGGLCPGINDVIRSIVMELHYRYKVPRILGFRYGYEGLIKRYNHAPIPLYPETVAEIHRDGGSILSSSRGAQNPAEMVDYLCALGVNVLFCIGGDGTLRGAQAVHEEIKKRGVKISVIGIPKTIDNDINFIHKTFGFSTAFAKAVDAIDCAHVEAKGADNGIGLVKLMGRHSGFIAVNAALAAKVVNFVLIPEHDFDLEGEGAFLETLKDRVQARKHAVIVVAEGAGQKFFEESSEKDPSGNQRLQDIGLFLKKRIVEYFHREGIECTLKYIDPSYIIRSVSANEEDSVFCGFLAQNAVHAGMAGKTGMVVGIWNNVFTNIPINMAVGQRKVLVPERSSLWRAVLGSTGQPNSMKAKTYFP
ncbi:MAG: ATP-dependent 6-phosphofructokinase [Leptospiraceae bacterium]|nr:ATP-dependent 6-phosphofructokinase [Leptospiraceae bacterium]MCP5502377.1 ATP-dependent 6-phosphofructokinase [Leptospiraceae bacterium]